MLVVASVYAYYNTKKPTLISYDDTCALTAADRICAPIEKQASVWTCEKI